MKTFTLTILLLVLTFQQSKGFVPEITFLIDDNFYDYTIVAERLSTSDPLFGQNFMEVGTSQYNYVTCSEFDFEQLVAPYDFRMGFLYLRNQGVPPDFPFIGEGKLRFSIYRGGNLVFTFKIDLVHMKSEPPRASPDLTFKYSHSTGILIAEAQTTMQVAYDQMIYCWNLHNEERDISWYVNDVELTNLIGGAVESNIKTTFNTAVMGFPDPENFQTGEEYPPSTFAPLWRGVYYGVTVSHTTYTKNNIVFNFRNWFEPENFSSSTTFRILENTSRFRSDFYPTHPLTVTNYLDGVSGGNFQLTWQNPPITQNWQFGTDYNAFRFEDPRNDRYSITALTPMQSLGTTWHFHKWNDGSTNNVKSNLQITAPTSFTAYDKGIQRSDDQNAYVNNSQRKFVRTDDGILHSVYSSQGRVWYETSSNNGVTWSVANNGQPLDNGEGKLPSIDYSIYYGQYEDYYQIFIVF